MRTDGRVDGHSLMSSKKKRKNIERLARLKRGIICRSKKKKKKTLHYRTKVNPLNNKKIERNREERRIRKKRGCCRHALL